MAGRARTLRRLLPSAVACMLVSAASTAALAPSRPKARSAQEVAHQVLQCTAQEAHADVTICPYVRELASVDVPAAWTALEAAAKADLRRALPGALRAPPEPVPDIQRAAEARCDLFPSRTFWSFREGSVEALLASLFQAIAAQTGTGTGVPAKVELDRFGLFHCHVFLSADDRLGLLFHAYEFPQLCKAFPFNLGYCQVGSPLRFSQEHIDWRNFVFYKGRLAALNLSERSPLLPGLVPEWLRPLRTTYEGDFGIPLGDVYFFPEAVAPGDTDLLLCFPRYISKLGAHTRDGAEVLSSEHGVE